MMYKLEGATNKDIELLKSFKLDTILNSDNYISDLEKNKIINYVNLNVSKMIDTYRLIMVEEQIIGCILVYDHLDGMLLDELYLIPEYRNKGIGTDLIKQISNNVVYLWVYKNNNKAYNLYCRLGFKIIEETETRYFMKYKK